MVTKTEIAKRVGIHLGTVSKILNRVPDHRASDKTVRKVFSVAIQLGYNFSSQKHYHKREFPRKQVELNTLLRFKINNDDVTLKGIARDISPGGIMIDSFSLQPEFLPTCSSMEVFLTGSPIGGKWVKCFFVRYQLSDTGMRLCVRPVYNTESERKEIEHYVAAS